MHLRWTIDLLSGSCWSAWFWSVDDGSPFSCWHAHYLEVFMRYRVLVPLSHCSSKHMETWGLFHCINRETCMQHQKYKHFLLRSFDFLGFFFFPFLSFAGCGSLCCNHKCCCLFCIGSLGSISQVLLPFLFW